MCFHFLRRFVPEPILRVCKSIFRAPKSNARCTKERQLSQMEIHKNISLPPEKGGSEWETEKHLRHFVNFYALVIGINKYRNSDGSNTFRDLSYCVSDANDIADLLHKDFGVPTANIKNLRDEGATRANIISAIKAFALDDRIQRDSPIFIFYAGHGAISKHAHSHLQYEVLCPSDVTIQKPLKDSSPSHEEVSGIPDYEIQRLLNEVASKKGNNIALFLDCCHSASMSRDAFLLSERGIIDPSPLSDWDFPKEVLRDGGTVPTAVGRNHESHVLLAACGKNETAKECRHTEHGWLTAALLRVFRRIPVQSLTYATLLNNLEVTCPDCSFAVTTDRRRQVPHCDGLHVERHLFKTTTLRSRIRGRRINTSMTVPCGSISGTLRDSRFRIYGTEDADSSLLGVLRASEVSIATTILSFLPENSTFSVPDIFYAEQLDWFATFRVYSDQLKLEDMLPDLEVFGICSIADKASADAWIEMEGPDVLFHHGRLLPEKELLGERLCKIPLAKLQDTLLASAAFYHHLLRESPGAFKKVSIELVYFNIEIGFHDVTVHSVIDTEDIPNPSGQFNKKATVFVDMAKPLDGMLWTKPIGMRLQNPTNQDLYVYSFIFLPVSLTIQAWNYVARADEPDSTLPARSQMIVGSGLHGNPYGFYLDPSKGEEEDVAYIKIFLSTIPCPHLAHIVQDPFRGEVTSDSSQLLSEVSEPRNDGCTVERSLRASRLPIMPALSCWDVQTFQILCKM